jgi:hypothetical protein
MCQEEVFKFCLDTRNNRTLPLDPACPEHLSLWSPGQSTLQYFFHCLPLALFILSLKNMGAAQLHLGLSYADLGM